jgi:hypothetical protein
VARLHRRWRSRATAAVRVGIPGPHRPHVDWTTVTTLAPRVRPPNIGTNACKKQRKRKRNLAESVESGAVIVLITQNRPRNAASATVGLGASNWPRAGAPAQPAPVDPLLSTQPTLGRNPSRDILVRIPSRPRALLQFTHRDRGDDRVRRLGCNSNSSSVPAHPGGSRTTKPTSPTNPKLQTGSHPVGGSGQIIYLTIRVSIPRQGSDSGGGR